MTDKDKTYYRREWLNKERQGGSSTGMAAIRAKEWELSISDCHRTVALDFYIDDDYINMPDVNNAEYKIDTLFEVIKQFRSRLKRKVKKIKKANASQ